VRDRAERVPAFVVLLYCASGMPNPQKFVTSIRPTDANHHMAWETLTHAETGKHGP
jgi:hypothetical protein